MTSAESHAPPAAAAVPPDLSRPVGRIGAIDLARGFAVCLMILSHGTNGLLPYDQFPDWGQVPVHAITKFSSSLFVSAAGGAIAGNPPPSSRSASGGFWSTSSASARSASAT